VAYIYEVIYFEEYGTYLVRIVLDQTNGYLYFAATSARTASSFIDYIGVINPSNFNRKKLITSLRYVRGLAIYPSKG